MPIYQTNNVSEYLKIGVWKITETEEELLSSFINKGFPKSTIFPWQNMTTLNYIINLEAYA